jgi:4-aminobutyrate aminotransferase-like enzyme
LEYLENNNVIEDVEAKGTYLKNLLEKVKVIFPFIGDIRGKGLLIGIEFVCNPKTKQSFPRELNVTECVVKMAKNIGLLLYPATAGEDGKSGDAIIISPPLTITNREIEKLVGLFKSALTKVQEELETKGVKREW